MRVVKGTDFTSRPLIIFWETTKSCDLSCRHCRASAMKDPLPGELDVNESIDFVRSIKDFGKPYPRLIITGGDPLKKKGLHEILQVCRDEGISVSLTPAVTDRLTEETVRELVDLNVRSYAISLDGAGPEFHDELRGVPGTFRKTVEAIDMLTGMGMAVQVNTAVMRSNINELPKVLKLLSSRRIMTWVPFFLIRTGRGNELEDLTPQEYEDVNNWLNFASHYGIRVRTVESPLFRRISMQRQEGTMAKGGDLYRSLRKQTLELMGAPQKSEKSYFIGSRDGSGVVFVSHDGYVTPSGFLPVQTESVRNRSLASIYRENELFLRLRDPKSYTGKCSYCSYNTICGGSRARAYFSTGNMLGSDPSCIYVPSPA